MLPMYLHALLFHENYLENSNADLADILWGVWMLAKLKMMTIKSENIYTAPWHQKGISSPVVLVPLCIINY